MKYYLVFYSDNGNREDCSVYYSWLVRAKNKAEAIEKVRLFSEQEEELDAEEMKLIE